MERLGGRRGALRVRRGPAAGRAEDVRRPTAVFRSPRARSRRDVRARRVRLGVRRVARVFARVRQKGSADQAGALLPQDERRQKGAPEVLRRGHQAPQEPQVQPAPVCRVHVVRPRVAQTVRRSSRARAAAAARGQGVRAERARP